MAAIKWLVASDLDGTLLPYNVPNPGKQLPPDVIPMLLHLQELGVAFCAASGRPIEPLHQMFAPLGEDCCYLAENGSWIFRGSELLEINPLNPESCEKVAAVVTPRTDCVLRVNTTKHKYFIVQKEETAEYLRNWKYADKVPILSINSFSQVEGVITQMTVTSFGDVAPIARELESLETPGIKPAITGVHWLDYSAADKGTGLVSLCRHLQIPIQRVIAFGDNFNDEPMLDVAGHPYIMEEAPKKLLGKYPNHCSNVVQTLLQLEKDGFFR